MSEGKKHDSGKPPMELLSHQALVEIAKVFGHGKEKYGAYNYRAGIQYSRIIGAAYRHLGAFNSGENLDPESGYNHVAHLGCCVIMLLDMIREHSEMDDRYDKHRPASDLEAAVDKMVKKEEMNKATLYQFASGVSIEVVKE